MIDLPTVVADEYSDLLKRIPGISSYSIGITMDPDFDKIAALGVQWIEPLMQTGTEFKFCVKTRRSLKTFPHTSPEINLEVGSRIMSKLSSKGLVVNIK